MAKKTRLIIDGEVLTIPHFSGIGHYTLALLRAIDHQMESRKDITVSLIVYIKQIRKAKDLGLKHVRILPSPFSLRISNGLKSYRKQPYLDLIFGKGIYLFPNFTAWPLIYSKSLPIIYDLSFEKFPQYAAPRTQLFLSQHVKTAAKNAWKVITISENSKKEIADFYGIDQAKIHIVYPGVDQAVYKPKSEQDIKAVLGKYHLKAPYILFVGNLEPRKNLKNLLLAYEKLPEQLRQKYSLLLVGVKGWQDAEIVATIERLRNNGLAIQQPSHRVSDDDLPAIYSGSSAFVYPSFYEGFGIPPIEAMSCGVPVIVANNSSLPEAAGEAGWYVDASSIDSITDAMREVLQNKELRKRLVKKGYLQGSSFTWDAAAKQLLDAIRD